MARVYRNIALPVRLAGLDLPDALSLAIVFVILFNAVNSLAFNAVVLVALYAALKRLRRGRPSGYLTSRLRWTFVSGRRPVWLERA